MKRLLCFIKGGHRYADKNIKVYQHPNPDYVKIHNECVKCGKEIEFDFCLRAYLQAELKKMKGESNEN